MYNRPGYWIFVGCRKEGNFNATAGYNNLVAAAAGRGIGKEQLQERDYVAAAGQRILGDATGGTRIVKVS